MYWYMYWLYKKLPSNRSDCTLALRALKVSYSDVGEGGVALNWEKNTIFPEHPVPSLLREEKERTGIHQ